MSELREVLSKQAHEQFAALNQAAEALGCPQISLEMGSRQFALAAAFIALTAARKAEQRIDAQNYDPSWEKQE